MNKSILIVEDDPKICDCYRSYLEDYSSKIFFADNAKSALLILKDNNIQLAIVDINIPGADGFEFIEISKIKYPQLLFLIISGSASCVNLHYAIKAQVFDFIEKPFSRISILEAVERAFKQLKTLKNSTPIHAVTREMIKEKTVLKQSLILELKDVIYELSNATNFNLEIFRQEVDQLFDLKLHEDEKGLEYTLTKTEKKVSEMLTAGINAQVISKRMDRSINTVQAHIKSIRRKAGLTKNKTNSLSH